MLSKFETPAWHSTVIESVLPELTSQPASCLCRLSDQGCEWVQGSVDMAAVSSFFGECAALRLSGGPGAGSAARAPVRRTAVQGAYPGAAQKPLLMHSPGHGSGPPLPPHMPYTSPQVRSHELIQASWSLTFWPQRLGISCQPFKACLSWPPS